MHRNIKALALAGLGTLAGMMPAQALDNVTFDIPGASQALRDTLEGASQSRSLLEEQKAASKSDSPRSLDAQEVYAAARADYARILGALYAEGYYSGTIRILIDGREAADIAPLMAPRQIGTIRIDIDPGPQFVFDEAEIAPTAPGTTLPPGYRVGEIARSTVVRQAADAGIDAWRQVGHAKARVADQSMLADHASRQLAARIALDPGPQARIGQLRFTGQQRMREGRLLKIAGLKEGEVYSPEELRRAADRLRRTGVFRSVAIVEDETLGPGGVLDVTVNVSEMPLRRIGFGGELTSTEGATLSAFWLHRNLLGGGEKLRLDAEATRIGLESGLDWRLGVELERPSSFTPDTTARLALDTRSEMEEGVRVDRTEIGFGLRHYFSDTLIGRADLRYGVTRAHDPNGQRTYRSISLPVGAVWDRRDSILDPHKGFWLDAEVMPFLGLEQTGSGVRGKIDLRGYHTLAERFTLAARLQAGLISGPDLLDTPRDYLFWSGGGGTVRGTKYRSLGIDRPGLPTIGGMEFIGGSFEVRSKATESIGIVTFVDYGRITAPGWKSVDADWQAGAGIGLRYATPVGPLRFDIATPVGGGRGGDGVQFYLGIGQAF